MTGQRNDSQRKAQIRAAAARCFVQRGYAATRLLDIAKEAGLSKGGVYFHYRAKEQLFHDILDGHLGRLQSHWSFEPVGDTAPADALRRLVLAHLHTITDEPDDGRLFWVLLTMSFRDLSFRDRLDEVESAVRDLYATVIARGMEAGVFSPGDANVRATSAVALVRGLACAAAVSKKGTLPIPPELAAVCVLEMVGLQSPSSTLNERGAAQ